MDSHIEQEIRNLLAEGKKIQAIKVYREATGSGLAEAKDAVEQLESSSGVADGLGGDQTNSQVDTSALADEILGLLQQSQKIEAIKRYREQTGVGLKEAKDIVDQIEKKAGIESPSGCLGAAVLIAGTVSAIAATGLIAFSIS